MPVYHYYQRTFMLAPHTARRGKIMNFGQVLELVDWRLALWNTKFVLELSRSCDSHTELVILELFLLKII
jgi:hypothetical protein